MDNLILKSYFNILNEGFTLSQSVYKPILDYYIQAYKKVREQGIKRITDKTFPIREFPLDLKGSRYEVLEYLNPKIKVELTASDSAYYKTGSETIVIGLKAPIRTVIDVIEHELLHYIQDLFRDHLKNKYRDNPNLLPDRETTYGTKEHYGGVSKKKIIPVGMDIHGRIKTYSFSLLGGYQIGKLNRKGNFEKIEIVSNSKKDAYKELKKLFFVKSVKLFKRNPYDFLYYPLKETDFKTGNIEVRTIPSNKRTLHTYRPIEYWTDLISNLRHLQKSYMDSLSIKYGDNKEKINSEIYSEKSKKEFFVKKYQSNNLFIYGTDIHPDWKKSYLKLMYKLFVSDNTPFENYDYVKKIREIYAAEIPSKEVPKSKFAEFYRELEKNFGINESSFDRGSIKIDSDSMYELSNLSDGNYEFVDDMFAKLNFTSKESKLNYESYYLIPKALSAFYKIFKNLRNIVIDEKRKWKENPNDNEIIGGESDSQYPSYYNVLYFAYHLLELYIRENWPLQRKLQTANKLLLFEFLMGTMINGKERNFIGIE